jgi:hypothetical protein
MCSFAYFAYFAHFEATPIHGGMSGRNATGYSSNECVYFPEDLKRTFFSSFRISCVCNEARFI